MRLLHRTHALKFYGLTDSSSRNRSSSSNISLRSLAPLKHILNVKLSSAILRRRTTTITTTTISKRKRRRETTETATAAEVAQVERLANRNSSNKYVKENINKNNKKKNNFDGDKQKRKKTKKKNKNKKAREDENENEDEDDIGGECNSDKKKKAKAQSRRKKGKCEDKSKSASASASASESDNTVIIVEWHAMPSTAGSAASVGALINSASGDGVSMGGLLSGSGGIGIGGNGGGATGSGGVGSVVVGGGGSVGGGTLITQTTAGTSAASGTITWDNNGTLRSANPGDWSIEQCLMWQQPHHLYFQLGNAFFFLAFLAPHGPFGMLWMRALLLIACILMGMYGYLIECTPDVVLWSGLSLGVNFVYLIVVLCRLRPVRFDKEIEAVYISLFKPLRVTRHQFKKVLNCMKVIRALKYQEVYAQEKVTKVDSLSLVLSGKLVVSQHQRALHIVFPHQFLDSPEWFGVSTDDYFQVSIMAMEESRVLIWHRDKLKLSIMTEPFLQTVFDHILGRDVVKKLMQVTQVSESIASNGFLPSGGYAEDAEDKPMLILKKSVDVGHGLTALINRQLQALPRISKYYDCAGDPNSWRLGRIDETDHETAV